MPKNSSLPFLQRYQNLQSRTWTELEPLLLEIGSSLPLIEAKGSGAVSKLRNMVRAHRAHCNQGYCDGEDYLNRAFELFQKVNKGIEDYNKASDRKLPYMVINREWNDFDDMRKKTDAREQYMWGYPPLLERPACLSA